MMLLPLSLSQDKLGVAINIIDSVKKNNSTITVSYKFHSSSKNKYILDPEILHQLS